MQTSLYLYWMIPLNQHCLLSHKKDTKMYFFWKSTIKLDIKALTSNLSREKQIGVVFSFFQEEKSNSYFIILVIPKEQISSQSA